MNEEQYQKLYQETISNTKSNTKYIIKQELLYKQNKEGQIKRVIKRWEIEPILYTNLPKVSRQY